MQTITGRFFVYISILFPKLTEFSVMIIIFFFKLKEILKSFKKIVCIICKIELISFFCILISFIIVVSYLVLYNAIKCIVCLRQLLIYYCYYRFKIKFFLVCARELQFKILKLEIFYVKYGSSNLMSL